MKYIKLILLVTFLSSCSTNKSIFGLYGKCEKGYFACTQIELKSDKTFEYFTFMDVGGGHVLKGTWQRVSKDTIVINTYKQPEIEKTTYIGKTNPNFKEKIKIKISDKNGPLVATNIFVNDREKNKVADENGVAEFEVSSLLNIEYVFLGQHEKIKIDNPDYNEIEILVKDLDINAVSDFITNEKIVLKRNKIIMDTTYIYKKTSLENKQW